MSFRIPSYLFCFYLSFNLVSPVLYFVLNCCFLICLILAQLSSSPISCSYLVHSHLSLYHLWCFHTWPKTWCVSEPGAFPPICSVRLCHVYRLVCLRWPPEATVSVLAPNPGAQRVCSRARCSPGPHRVRSRVSSSQGAHRV